VDDELSKKIKVKAAAQAFVGSIYMWAILLLVSMRTDWGRNVLIVAGIVGILLIFIGLWVYYNTKGIGNEDSN